MTAGALWLHFSVRASREFPLPWKKRDCRWLSIRGGLEVYPWTEEKRAQLYDLSKDVGKQNNVQAEHPKGAKRPATRLSALRKGK